MADDSAPLKSEILSVAVEVPEMEQAVQIVDAVGSRSTETQQNLRSRLLSSRRKVTLADFGTLQEQQTIVELQTSKRASEECGHCA